MTFFSLRKVGFTRFRRMTERRGQIGEISKEQAALIGAAIKLLSKV